MAIRLERVSRQTWKDRHWMITTMTQTIYITDDQLRDLVRQALAADIRFLAESVYSLSDEQHMVYREAVEDIRENRSE